MTDYEMQARFDLAQAQYDRQWRRMESEPSREQVEDEKGERERDIAADDHQKP